MEVTGILSSTWRPLPSTARPMRYVTKRCHFGILPKQIFRSKVSSKLQLFFKNFELTMWASLGLPRAHHRCCSRLQQCREEARCEALRAGVDWPSLWLWKGSSKKKFEVKLFELGNFSRLFQTVFHRWNFLIEEIFVKLSTTLADLTFCLLLWPSLTFFCKETFGWDLQNQALDCFGEGFLEGWGGRGRVWCAV